MSLILSLKPNYADLIFDGLKTAEFRKRFSKSFENRKIFVYVSSPVKQIRGGFQVENVLRGSPEEVWHKVSEVAGIDKSDFDTYYSEREVAYALRITNIWECKNPVSLETLRRKFDKFVVPQSWRYLKPEESFYFSGLWNCIEYSDAFEQ